MSKARSNRTPRRVDLPLLLAAVLCLCAAGLAHARQSDKHQPINVRADAFSGSQDSGKIVFTGNFHMDQGSFAANGAQATGYTDPNDTSQWQRVVVTGNPARFQQTQDSGTLVRGQARTIDYRVSENTVVLTGDAAVVQEGRGTFRGEKLVYNTDSGEIEGSANTGGQVHITLQPRSKPVPAKVGPAGATSAPAPASTSGQH
jgi:lipopolysaccharide export system protein LptA